MSRPTATKRDFDENPFKDKDKNPANFEKDFQEIQMQGQILAVEKAKADAVNSLDDIVKKCDEAKIAYEKAKENYELLLETREIAEKRVQFFDEKLLEAKDNFKKFQNKENSDEIIKKEDKIVKTTVKSVPLPAKETETKKEKVSGKVIKKIQKKNIVKDIKPTDEFSTETKVEIKKNIIEDNKKSIESFPDKIKYSNIKDIEPINIEPNSLDVGELTNVPENLTYDDYKFFSHEYMNAFLDILTVQQKIGGVLKKLNGKFGGAVLLSEEDYEELKDNNMHFIGCKKYVAVIVNGKQIRLSRYLMDPPDDKYVDHIDSQVLNYTRDNLRIVPPSFNACNRSSRVGSSTDYVGVHKKLNKFYASVKPPKETGKKRKWIGSYDTVIEAAEARDIYLVQNNLNFDYGYKLAFPEKLEYYKTLEKVPEKEVKYVCYKTHKDGTYESYIDLDKKKINILRGKNLTEVLEARDKYITDNDYRKMHLNFPDKFAFKPIMKTDYEKVDDNIYRLLIKDENENYINALVDADEYDKLKYVKWYLDNVHGYIRGNYLDGTIKLHRFILGRPEPDKPCIDHINNNKIDNRKCNLRHCTYRDNAKNRIKKKNSSSKFYGVSFNATSNSWRAHVGKEGKNLFPFDDPDEEFVAIAREIFIVIDLEDDFYRRNFKDWTKKDFEYWEPIVREAIKKKSHKGNKFTSFEIWKQKNSKDDKDSKDDKNSESKSELDIESKFDLEPEDELEKFPGIVKRYNTYSIRLTINHKFIYLSDKSLMVVAHQRDSVILHMIPEGPWHNLYFTVDKVKAWIRDNPDSYAEAIEKTKPKKEVERENPHGVYPTTVNGVKKWIGDFTYCGQRFGRMDNDKIIVTMHREIAITGFNLVTPLTKRNCTDAELRNWINNNPAEYKIILKKLRGWQKKIEALRAEKEGSEESIE
jgi:hypothetical protein